MASGGWGAFVYFIALFVVIFGYDILFEVLASGRTPGKRLNGLRVVRVGGFPIGFLASSIRNTLRLVDFLPSGYLVGCVAILVTRAQPAARRPGCGDARRARAQGDVEHARAAPGRAAVAYPTWDVGTITTSELQTVRQFLERRSSIEARARAQLAHTLAERPAPEGRRCSAGPARRAVPRGDRGGKVDKRQRLTASLRSAE